MNTNTEHPGLTPDDPTKRPDDTRGTGVPATSALEASGSSPPPGYVPGANEHGPFLRAIPPRFRGAVANQFLSPVRAGLTDPETIARSVHEKAWRTTGWPEEGVLARSWAEAVVDVLYAPDYDDLDVETREDAEDMARWALWWESLPKAERDRIKAERSRAHLGSGVAR